MALPQIYPANDWQHFVLHLFLASHWGLQTGWSFNAPIWSVSVEVLIYAGFLVYWKVQGIRLRSALLWLAVMLLVFQGLPRNEFQQCAVLFALGGLLCPLHQHLVARRAAHHSAAAAFALLIGSTAWLVQLGHWQPDVVLYGVFPALLWCAASLESLGVAAQRAGLWLGQLTYASYLIHVPLQIALMSGMEYLGLNRTALVQTPTFFLGFFALVIVLSDLTFRHIERPLKHLLREKA